MAEENSTTNEGKNDSVKGVRTFEDDIANYTKEKNFSILDIVAEEAKMRGLSFENPEEGNNFFNFRNIILIFIVVLFVIAGGYFGFEKRVRGGCGRRDALVNSRCQNKRRAKNKLDQRRIFIYAWRPNASRAERLLGKRFYAP